MIHPLDITRRLSAASPPAGEMVETAAGAVHLLSAGTGPGLPAVLLHGASGNLLDWRMGAMPLLARERRVVAMDRPGFGHTPAGPGESWRFPGQRRPLAAALDRLGLTRCVLVGHSWSGALALDWALAEPERVAGLVLLSGASMEWGGELGSHYRIGSKPGIGPAIARLVGLTVTERRLQRTLACIFAPQRVPERYADRAGVRLALRPGTFRQNVRAMAALHGQIVANQPRYGEIGCPAEIIHGTVDDVVPASIHAEPLSKILPNARLTLLKGMGHMPHHDNTGIAAIGAALTRIDASTR